MGLKLRIPIFLLLTSLILSCYAQFPFSLHYTVNDGLPSSEILDISQDNDGNIWFATAYGLCSFNGYEFKTYTVPEIPDQSFILIQKGKNNKLWFLSYTGYLCFLKDRKLYSYQYNDTLQKLAGKDFLHSVKVDEKDRVWFRGKEKNQIICLSGDTIHSADTVKHFYSWHPLVFYNFFQRDQDKEPVKTLFKICQNISYPQLRPEAELYQIKDQLYKLTYDNKLCHLGRANPQKNHKINNVDIFEEPNGNIWIRKNLKGALFYPRGDLLHSQQYLADKRLTRIMKDREGNYWFATEGEGVYLVPSFQFNIFPYSGTSVSSDNIIAFDFRKNNIIFSTNDNKTYSASIKDGLIKNPQPFILDDMNVYGRDILWQKNGHVWIIQSNYLRYNTSGTPLPLNMVILHKPYEAIELSDGSVAIATIQGFYIYRNGKLVFDSRKDTFLEHIQAIYQDARETLWLGTVTGLYSYKNGKYKYWGNESKILAGRISKINGNDEETWVGTRENGIAIINNDDIIFINADDGMNSNVIKSMLITDTISWIGTNKGLSKVLAGSHPVIIENYTVWDGLPSNEINDITMHGSYLWVATNKGIASIKNGNIIKPQIPPSLMLNGININQHDTLLLNSYNLKPDQNNIKINYTGITFKDPGKIIYEISSESKIFQSFKTTSTTTSFPDLSPGNYKIIISGCNIDNNCTTLEKAIVLNIQKPFTDTIAFIVGLIIIISGIIVVVFWMVFRNRQNKERIKRAMLQSEQKALRAQMNPHFIFNSLNSIQYFLLENENEHADEYLANFSRLMRRILENSKNNFISLHEELETIKLYLDLEKLRFEDKFDYKVLIDESIDPELVSIPPMILQPYLENAIWHGIMPKEGKGTIMIRLSELLHKSLKITIEDNGIGRKSSAEISAKRKGHRSTAMKNIEERINLINTGHKTKMKVNITDLTDDDNNPSGTRIELIIPS